MNIIEPSEVVELVEAYIYKELSDGNKYENRMPLDESGCFGLHRLAADIYVAGYADGERAESRRRAAERVRERESKS